MTDLTRESPGCTVTTMTFEALFAEDKSLLDRALADNWLEQNHQRRCMELAHLVNWKAGNRDNEFARLLGPHGVNLFDQTLLRIKDKTKHLLDPQLQDPQQFLIYALFVHDLGKYDATIGRFNGIGHEERSAQIVERQRTALCRNLGWSEESADLLIGLARFHSFLGVIHLGGASMVYLEPLLLWLLPHDESRQRLFLDLLIALNCCDAGASGNFETQQFYLNHERLQTYCQAAEQLMEAASQLRQSEHLDPAAVLIEQATTVPNMVKRIQRIVASGNALSATTDVVTAAITNAIKSGVLNPRGFALTRFDHGAYVFEPLLHRLSPPSGMVSVEMLDKLLRLIGFLSMKTTAITIVQFRDSFSMKPDLQPQNHERFEILLQAVERGQIEAISSIPLTVVVQ